MTSDDAYRQKARYLTQTIRRCNLLLAARAPSRCRLDLITQRLRAVLGIVQRKRLTRWQLDLLLAKAYSATNLLRPARVPRVREVRWEWRKSRIVKGSVPVSEPAVLDTPLCCAELTEGRYPAGLPVVSGTPGRQAPPPH